MALVAFCSNGSEALAAAAALNESGRDLTHPGERF
jgi:hypothetical protein